MGYFEARVFTDGDFDVVKMFSDEIAFTEWLVTIEDDAITSGVDTKVFATYHWHEPGSACTCDDGELVVDVTHEPAD